MSNVEGDVSSESSECNRIRKVWLVGVDWVFAAETVAWGGGSACAGRNTGFGCYSGCPLCC
jgi:hypothetical protein